ncbi:MAG: YIP1 family protein [Ignavibacteriae bacterium]|nr:YIP1 family protein [Ignavibacteriota bacterium]
MNNNFNICQNCGEKNPLYLNKCTKCHHYFRAAVVNIDLWSTIWRLFETPKDALKNIIYAEHKNFITFLTFFLSIKLLLISAFVQSFVDDSVMNSKSFIYNILIQAVIYTAFFIFFSILLNVGLKKFTKTKFKNTFAVTIFSFIPTILTLFFLTPIEYGIFGKHWFIFNPSPFLIKEIPAYILTLVELIFIIWSVIIFWKGIKLQSNSNFFSIAMIIFFLIFLISIILKIPYIIF